MKRRALFPIYLAGIFLLFSLCISGCRTWVNLSNYSPTFDTKPYERFRGHTVYMPSFYYEGFSFFRDYLSYYYSIDAKIGYNPGRYIESYLWYSFQDAMKHAGVTVLDYPEISKDGKMRELKVLYSTLTDEEFPFQILFYVDNTIKYSKKFSIKEPPRSRNIDRKELERRAYKMIDSAVTFILGDPAFQEAFF